jgi:hypothetical protein
MFKRIAAVTLMLGAAVAIAPAIGSAQENDRGYSREYNRDRSEYRDRNDRVREFRGDGARERAWREREHRDREHRERFEYNRYRETNRGFYDRFGYWHWY